MSAADEYFKKAEVAAKKGNYEYAIELMIQGLILDPKAAEQRRVLHRLETLAVQQKGGNPAGGMAAKLKLMPLQATIRKLFIQKRWEEAIVEIEKALRYQPQNVQLLWLLAQALENYGAQDAAIVVLEDLIQLDKANVEAYRKLGALWATKDDPEKAIEYWQKVQQYRPDDKEAGKAIRDLSAATMVKKAEERKKLLGDESFRALIKDEEQAADLEKKARIIRTDEDRLEAIRLKKEEIRSDPKNSRLWRELGALYQELKRWDVAEKAFLKAMEVNPHDLFAQEKLGALREARLDDELQALERQVQEAAGKPEEGELRNLLEKKRAEALEFKIQEYDRRVKAHPTDYELKLRYGQLLMQAGRWDEAIEQFQKSVKDPKFRIRSLNLIGNCFREKGLYPVAEQQYKQALEGIADKDSEMGKEVMYNLGLVAEKQRQREAALNCYQQIMAMDIGYRDVSSRVSTIMAGGWPD